MDLLDEVRIVLDGTLCKVKTDLAHVGICHQIPDDFEKPRLTVHGAEFVLQSVTGEVHHRAKIETRHELLFSYDKGKLVKVAKDNSGD
ncbi:MAG: hypothetical protein CME61_00490 [Halobacteriovoraceae bacterium]|nr:hypothetical protein [Halobacteriovoraceae bacterium]|tara:strand:+ start:904 stop:1167 length:264 start_codon:yes stop_codon:yes gene_type:complete